MFVINVIKRRQKRESMWSLLVGKGRELSVSTPRHWAEVRRHSSLEQVQVFRGEAMSQKIGFGQKIMRKWKYKGLHCLVVLNDSLAREWFCGYVAVSRNHPDWRKDDEDVDVKVHGGLTWSIIGTKDSAIWPNPNLWYFGFDCGHAGDDNDKPEWLKQNPDYPRMPIPQHKWTLDEVVAETTRLAEELNKRQNK